MTGPVLTPDIPLGTELQLTPGMWGTYEGILAEAKSAIRVHAVYPARNADGYWLIGHGLECGWQSVEPHAPCMEVYVRAALLVEAGYLHR